MFDLSFNYLSNKAFDLNQLFSLTTTVEQFFGHVRNQGPSLTTLSDRRILCKMEVRYIFNKFSAHPEMELRELALWSSISPTSSDQKSQTNITGW